MNNTMAALSPAFRNDPSPRRGSQTFTKRKLFLLLSLALFTASASAGPLVYAVSTNYNNFTGQFGTVDLSTGTFNQIGPLSRIR